MWFGFAFRMARPASTLMNQTNHQPLAVGLASTYELATTGSYFSLLACSMYEADLWLISTVEQPLRTSVPSAWTWSWMSLGSSRTQLCCSVREETPGHHCAGACDGTLARVVTTISVVYHASFQYGQSRLEPSSSPKCGLGLPSEWLALRAH
jgi:hypothetical protein